MKTAIVSSVIGGKPLNGGNAWAVLSWAEGLRRLGLRVVFVEQVPAGGCADTSGAACPPAESVQFAYFREAIDQLGFTGHAALVYNGGEQVLGMSRGELLDTAAADLLLNVTGHLTWAPVKERCRRKVYLDLDPGYTQFWHAAGGEGPRLAGHDFFYTVGMNVGSPGCPIPIGGIPWRPVRQPVVLDHWPVVPPATARGGHRFTTVASWRGAYGRVEWEGKTYGLKAHEFRKFADVPRLASVDFPAGAAPAFEIALDIHPGDDKDRRLLLDRGWHLADPKQAAGTPHAFRRYVQGSAAEFSVAQSVYVETHSGWFSDRTVRYLASGKPAVVQDTGLARHLPAGEGLLTFRTPDEAAGRARQVLSDYPTHCRAARQLAREFFEAGAVLSQLLNEIA